MFQKSLIDDGIPGYATAALYERLRHAWPCRLNFDDYYDQLLEDIELDPDEPCISTRHKPSSTNEYHELPQHKMKTENLLTIHFLS